MCCSVTFHCSHSLDDAAMTGNLADDCRYTSPGMLSRLLEWSGWFCVRISVLKSSVQAEVPPLLRYDGDVLPSGVFYDCHKRHHLHVGCGIRSVKSDDAVQLNSINPMHRL